MNRMTLEMDFDYATAVKSMDKFSQVDIDSLREWSQKMDKSKYIPKDLTDKQLLIFYNACYGDMEKTKMCIEKFYNCRKHTPEFFDNRIINSPELKQSLETL